TVTSVSSNDVPTITGVITTNQPVETSSSILPFSPVTISDVDVGDAADTNFTVLKQRLTVQVTLTGTNVVGEMSSPVFVRVGNTYTTAPLVPTEATAAIQNARYVAPLLPVASTNLVGLTITVWDDHNGTNVNTATKVLVSTPYQTVSIRGTQGGRFVSDKETIVPFAGVTVQSLNGQPVVALISLNSSNKLRGEL